MRRCPFLLGIFCCCCLHLGCGHSQPARHFVTGYYASWRAHERYPQAHPSALPYAQYDIVIYAFLNVEPDGSLSLIAPERDKELLLGPFRPDVPKEYLESTSLGDPAYHRPGQRFADYAHRHRVRFTVSIGGWAHSTHFSKVAADPAKRARFAEACARAVALYNLDGIDIDWEYPGDLSRNGSPDDSQHFVALLRDVRHALDGLRQQLRRDLMLTIACGAAPKHIAAIPWPEVHRLVNAINLMAYSFYGQWDAISNHNAPLFPPVNATQPGYSCAEAVEALLHNGVPPAKINLGVAFYGRSYLTSGTAGLHTLTSGKPDSERFARSGATPSYYEIARQLRNGTYAYHWDDAAQVPYLVERSGASFVSFDDERSIGLKAHYVRVKQLRGVAIWDITGEYEDVPPERVVSAATPLTNAIHSAFSRQEPPSALLTQPRLCIFPNQIYSGFVHVFVHSLSSGRTEVALTDHRGKALHSVAFTSAGHSIDLRALPVGTYRLRVRFGASAAVETIVEKKK